MVAPATARWLVFDASGALVHPAGTSDLVLAFRHVLRLGAEDLEKVSLGTYDGHPCFVIELPAEHALAGGEWTCRPAREVIRFPADDAAALVSAGRQLLHWRRIHRFCGCCGTPMADKEDERARVCPGCGHLAFPRLNPAVIVAVHRDGELLLGRNSRYRQRRLFSLVAGFVEVGETLEQAVRREVLEETGVAIRNLVYFGSQAWPFPSTLMLGFRAEYAGGDIQLRDRELEEAGWFRAQALPEIPGPGIISRALIYYFVNRCRGNG
jgi:NAD+ diphosphatase